MRAFFLILKGKEMDIYNKFKELFESHDTDLDIYKRLKNDHDNQRGLMDSIAETSGDSGERRQLYALLKNELVAHANAEEQTFYAKLIHEPKGQEQARHSVSEHKEMDDLIEELEDTDMSSSGWLSKFKKLKEEVEHHVDEEEKEVFALSRKLISESEAHDLADEFNTRKLKERDAA